MGIFWKIQKNVQGKYLKEAHSGPTPTEISYIYMTTKHLL